MFAMCVQHLAVQEFGRRCGKCVDLNERIECGFVDGVVDKHDGLGGGGLGAGKSDGGQQQQRNQG